MVHLVSIWAERFMSQHADAELSVTGGGSGTGFAALINGTTDICAASRGIKAKEIKLAGDQGVTPREIAVARDAIVVVVNPGNPLDALSMPQIGTLFTGAADRWAAVGGPDKPVLVLSRESSSGTYGFFQEHVLRKADYSFRARLMPGTSAVVQAVAVDRWSVGYVGLGYAMESADEVKMLKVAKEGGDQAIMPSEETVRNGSYPISRELFFYVAGKTDGLAGEFIDFCLSPAGQQIVRETGYVAVR